MTDFASAWIAEREQLEEAATEGPWEAIEDDSIHAAPAYVDNDGCGVIAWRPVCDFVVRHCDAEFIADARTALPAAVAALKAVLTFATAERDKISRTYITQPDTAYAGYANAMGDVIRTIESALRRES